ncbi:hypothetical protein V8G54_024398 [Vigna mungo]|uniref:Uncharacterized protein n=1 Tax=Vigna mungo TaxID=3915 RepID=A0AAQ3N6W4_VIGMU
MMKLHSADIIKVSQKSEQTPMHLIVPNLNLVIIPCLEKKKIVKMYKVQTPPHSTRTIIYFIKVHNTSKSSPLQVTNETFRRSRRTQPLEQDAMHHCFVFKSQIYTSYNLQIQSISTTLKHICKSPILAVHAIILFHQPGARKEI